MGSRLPTSDDVVALERAPAGTSFNASGLDRQFLKHMQQCGYLDAHLRRTSGPERLRSQYRADGLVLFLGAGVSKASGIPDWRALIDRLLQSVGFVGPSRIDPGPLSLSRVLEEKAGMSLLSQFDLVAHQNDKRRTVTSDPWMPFETLLRQHLYADPQFRALRRLLNEIPERNDKKDAHDWAPLLAELRKNGTLAAVGDLLLEDAGGGHVSIDPRIHAVITTNVDNLLQVYVMARARGRRLLTTVDRPSVADHPGRLSLYHLHGWLDFRDTRKAPLPAPPLVFRESEYFDTIGNSNAFANYTAQSAFQRCNVLFLGTSMEDLNVRRWLYNSFTERRRSRAVFLSARAPGYAGAEAEAYAASIRHFWLKRDRDLPEPREEIKDALADSMRHLGVEIIWYQEHGQIADLLRSLKAGAGGHAP